jgi:hypothetical protein
LKKSWCALLLYDIGQWKVSKANAEKFLEMMNRFVEWQRQNRRKFYYTHSTFGIVRDEDQSAVTWMYIDEYKDEESYDKFEESFQWSNPENAGFLKLKEEFASLIVPDSYKCARVIEKPELRIT